MKFQALLAASLFVTVLAGCSSSSSDGGGTTPSVFCSTNLGGSSLCYGYTNLTSDQQKAVSDACAQAPLSGKIVTECPTSGIAGCCKYTAGGIATEQCYYTAGDSGIDPSTAAKQVCSTLKGTWSTGQ